MDHSRPWKSNCSHFCVTRSEGRQKVETSGTSELLMPREHSLHTLWWVCLANFLEIGMLTAGKLPARGSVWSPVDDQMKMVRNGEAVGLRKNCGGTWENSGFQFLALPLPSFFNSSSLLKSFLREDFKHSHSQLQITDCRKRRLSQGQ